MLATTGRCLVTWLKVTAVLAALVALVGLIWGWGSDPFVLAVVLAAVLELLAIRGLLREWSFEASGSWWWFG